MFEGKPPQVDQSAREALRPLAWSELASRLAAARELRAALAPGELEGEASFDAMSARWIAAHRTGEESVNREDSANGKGAGPSAAVSQPAAHRGAVGE